LTATQFDALYRTYGHLVHRRCRALLDTPVEAQDAVQEVFLRAYEKLAPDGTGSVLAWLYSVATHYCYDVRKRRGRQEAWAAPQSPATGLQPSVDGALFCKSLLGRVDAATCEIGLLHFLDGFTQEEVAERTGLSRRTVGKKLKALQELFHQEVLGGSPTS
jgi:RNA polymerase sigma factor (sigma-70 family)